MKKALLIGFAVLSSFQSYCQCAPLNKEGIYVAHIDSTTHAYLKFFGEDSVITTTSEIPTESSVANIIKTRKEFMLQGTYKTKKGCFIKMKLKGMTGKAKLEGYLMGNNIGLSKINLQNNTYVNLYFLYKEQ